MSEAKSNGMRTDVGEAELAKRIAELRAGFDQGFALPPPATSASAVSLLAIRLGSAAYAIRIAELTDVEPAVKLVALPGARRELLGLAGVRGRLLPVYDLAALLGQNDSGSRSWLAISGADEPLGVTFDELEGYLQVSPSEILPAEIERSRGHVRDVLRVNDTTRMVVSIASIITMLRGQNGDSADPRPRSGDAGGAPPKRP